MGPPMVWSTLGDFDHLLRRQLAREFRVPGFGFGAQDIGFRVQGLGFRVEGAGFRA